MWAFILMLVASAAAAESPESKAFLCTSNKSLMALKALYNCQNEEPFGECGALAGYLAGRPITSTAQTHALELLKKSKDQPLTPPDSNSISVIHAMANNQFEADIEDIFPVNPDTSSILSKAGLRLAAVKYGKWKYQPCLGKGEQYINAEPTNKCEANPLNINEATYKFINGTEEDHFKGLSDEVVCEHYTHRYEHLLRRTVFVEFSCGKDEVNSVVRGPNHNLERKIRYDANGQLTAIELRLSNETGSSVMEFAKGKPTFFNNYVPTKPGSPGQRTARWEASRLYSGHPLYSELARMKLEVTELIDCCRDTDADFKKRCQMAFATPLKSRSP